MAINKIVRKYTGDVLLDLTQDTVTAETLLLGVTAHNAAGELIVGEYEEGPRRYKFPTGEPGVYRHGSNFTELLYTWDEIWTNADKTYDTDDFESEYVMWDSAGGFGGTIGGDIILPEEPVPYEWGDYYNGLDLYCGNVVIPAWCTSVTLTDFKADISLYNRPNSTIDCNLEIIYIKVTTPPYFNTYVREEELPYLTKIVVPKGCANAYKSATGWCDFAEIIVEEGTVISGNNSVVDKSLAAKIIDQDPITEVTATDLQGLTKIPRESFSIMGIIAFQDSTGTYYYDTVEKITLPETVTEIASNGISYVPNLKSLTVLAKTPPTLGGYINGNGGGYTYPLYVPAASVDLYKAATNWSNYDIQAIA